MTKLLLALTLTPLLIATAHADETSDYINTNMLWSDTEEFHRMNISDADEIRNYRHSNMLWSDNEEFHRLDSAQAFKILDYRNASMLWPDRLTFSQADQESYNSNMLCSDDYVFRHINHR